MYFVTLGEELGFVCGDFSQLFKIQFVADQSYNEFFDSAILLYFAEPLFNSEKGFEVGYVVD